MMKRCLIEVILALALFLASAMGQSGTIDVDKGDEHLKITGWIDENAFTGNLRLIANGSDIKDFELLASDLKQDDGDQIIGRQNVALVGDRNLTAGVPKDYKIAISNVKDPGTYRGSIQLMVPGKSDNRAKVIDLVVEAKSKTKLTPLTGSEKVKLHLVNSDSRFAKIMLPAGFFMNEWELQLDNPTQSNAAIIGSNFTATGEKTGYQLTGKHLSLPRTDLRVPSDRIATVTLKLNRKEIPADSYSGSIYLIMDRGQEKLTIPVTIDMRVGSWWVVVALFFGIVLGRLFKFTQDREPQTKALGSVNRIENLISGADPEDQKILNPMIKEVRTNVYSNRTENVDSDLKAIETRLESLNKLRETESLLKGKQGEHIEGCMNLIKEARGKISLKEDEAVKTILGELKTKLDAISKSSLMGPGQVGKEIGRASDLTSKALEEANKIVQAPPRPGYRDIIKRQLISLTALSDEIQAEATYWFVRPFLYVVLLLALLAMGLQSLYIENGLTFGVNHFVDYLGLVVWGLSSDVAGRSLSSLQANKG